jgi:hypothetical protein
VTPTVTADPIAALTAARAVRAARDRRCPASPAGLSRRLDCRFVVTPTIRLLSDIAVRSVTEPDRRDIVTTPPRTGKSRLLAVWTVVWALMRDPDLQIVLVSYSDELAQPTAARPASSSTSTPTTSASACPRTRRLWVGGG